MGTNYAKLSKVKKVELLEATVLNGTPEEVSDIYEKIGEVELSARRWELRADLRDLIGLLR